MNEEEEEKKEEDEEDDNSGIHHTIPSREFITALGPIIAMACSRRDGV